MAAQIHLQIPQDIAPSDSPLSPTQQKWLVDRANEGNYILILLVNYTEPAWQHLQPHDPTQKAKDIVNRKALCSHT